MINFLFLFHTILLTADAAAEPIKYKQNDRIHIASKLSCGDSQYSSFFPKLNKLSMLRVEANSLTTSCKIKFYSVENKGVESREYPLFKSDDTRYVVEFLSLILFFEKGNNTAINWDTSFDTHSCKNRKPIDKTCSIAYNSSSYKFIKVFAASVGTDKDNTPLSSAQNLPSTFVKFGVGGVIDDAASFVDKAGEWFNKKF